MNANIIYAALFVYFIIGSVLARRAGRNSGRSVQEFFLAGRSLGGIVAALTYSATTYSAFMLVGLAGFNYIGGVVGGLFRSALLVGRQTLQLFNAHRDAR